MSSLIVSGDLKSLDLLSCVAGYKDDVMTAASSSRSVTIRRSPAQMEK
jgi:hypothetical protein